MLSLLLEVLPIWQIYPESAQSSGQTKTSIQFWFRRVIVEQLAQFIVLPNKVSVPLVNNIPMKVSNQDLLFRSKEDTKMGLHTTHHNPPHKLFYNFKGTYEVQSQYIILI